MTFGMQMAGGPCTQTPTAAQQAATVRLVQQTWSADRKFQDLATARAAGYRPVGPGGAVVHYFNQDVYAGTIEHRTPLDPAAPPSLVYANTPAGAVLVAAMYVDAPGSTSPPAPGGCLTRWHVHTNLCFADGDFVALTPPACPPGSVNQVSPPMLHIWLVPVPGGPTAVDADDDAVVAAAEQVAHPPNGTA
jgi:hypothetical protein